MERRAVAFSVLEPRNNSFTNVNPSRQLIVNSWSALTWTCYYCTQGFQNYKAFKKHIQSAHQINSEDVYYKCNDCNGVSFSYVSFVNHIRRVHYESLKLCCDVCNEIFPNYEELSSHRAKHVEAGVVHPIVFHCTICELVHASEKDLRSHIQDVHSAIYNMICSQSTIQPIDVDVNMSQNNSPDISLATTNDAKDCKDEFFEIGELFQCGVCVQGFVNDAELEAHMLKHKEEQIFTFEGSNNTNLMEQLNATAQLELNFEEKLIEEVKKHNILFNIHHPQYKQANKKDTIWQDIAKILNSDAEQCKRRWKILRDQYTRCKKAEELPSGSSSGKRVKWKHFEALTFLDAVDRIRRATSTTDTVEIDSSPTNTPAPSYRSDHESVTLEPPPESVIKRQRLQQITLTDKHYEDLAGIIIKNIQETCARMRIKNKNPIESTFLSLALQISASDLPRDKSLRLQHRISNIVFDTLEEWEEEKRSNE